jgi:hypothetical protein
LRDLVVLLHTETSVRLARLRERELGKYGALIRPGGDLHKAHAVFLSKAANYDTRGISVRSFARDKHWINTLSCPTLVLNGAHSARILTKAVLARFQAEVLAHH